MADAYWKFLRAGARSPFTGFEWTSARSVRVEDPELCYSGIHACRVEDLPHWMSDELWRIELDRPIHVGTAKVVAARARLLERVAEWTPEMAGQLATECLRRCVIHAVAELRASSPEYDAQADVLEAAGLDEVGQIATGIGSVLPVRHRRAGWLCSYVGDAADARSNLPVGSVAFIAARAASERSDLAAHNGYALERAEQARWLIRHLPPLS